MTKPLADRLAYERMLYLQNGKCAICGREDNGARRFCVDHDHETGRIRGLLCGRCNTGLGFFEDNTEALRAALEYLEAGQEWDFGSVP